MNDIVGIIALIGAIALFVWGMISLGRNRKKKSLGKDQNRDDDFGENMFMMDALDDLD